MSSLIEQLQLAADDRDGGVELVAYGEADIGDCLRAAAPWSQEAGFSVARVGECARRRLPAELRHRHVLIALGRHDSWPAAIGWIRELAATSPRRHLVLLPSVPRLVASGSDPTGAGGLHGDHAAQAAADRRSERAARWRRRQRARIGDRWIIAAIEAARRRGDQPSATSLDLNLIETLIGRGDLDVSARRLKTYLTPDRDWPTFGRAAALKADLEIAHLRLGAARAWIKSVFAEADMRGLEPPPELVAAFSELDFWQARPMSRLWSSASADEIGWRALSAWMSGDADSISEFKSILRSRATDARYLYWRLLIDLLTGDRASSSCIEAQAQTLLGVADRLVRCRERRKRLVLAVAGQRWRSPALHGPEELVCQQLRAGAKRVPASYPPGVKFLASWRNRMPMVDGLPALLAVLEDADDELRVLTGGCQWLVERSGAERCAIVSADGGMLLAGEGWRTSDLAGEISGILRGPDRDVRHGNDGKAPSFGVSIRSLGVTIGFVVVRGRTTDRHALQQSALVLATLVAPATRSRLDAVAAAARARLNIPEIVGESPLMASVRDAIARAATAPFPILIEGESGTGKELVARALHRLGPRRDKRLNAVNCAALTDELVEAELFGHVRGAFTGAVGPRVGLFEESHGGTLFLDEVTELSPRAQAKLLRVLQEGEIRRVGENQARSVDVRIIAACNVPLADAVAAGRFREDLRYRLAVVRISVPPLRERIEDIPTLAMAFWRRAALEAGTRAAIGPDALARLTRHSWPGNVRELQNVIAGLVVLAPLRGRASARHVEQVLSHATPIADTPGVQLEAARRTFERRVIMSALSRHAGRRHAAAAELGLTRQGLTKALRRLGLTADENAAGVA